MNNFSLFGRCSRSIVLGFVLALAWQTLPGVRAASAQTTTTGAMRGCVKDKVTKEPLIGATVVAGRVDAADAGSAPTEITDETGCFAFNSLTPGRYRVTVYYNDSEFIRQVEVAAAKVHITNLFVTVTEAQTIEVKGQKVLVDSGSAKIGPTITREFQKNIPVPGRVSFSGATSAQNTYVVAGVGTHSSTHSMNTEGYARIDDNPFLPVASSPLSTFSIDVDTASYANVRRYLVAGQLPPKDAVRTEELLNYFRYDKPTPAAGAPFGLRAEIAESPWHAGHALVRVALATSDIAMEKAPPSNLVFLIDTSGSMEDPVKLPLLVASLRLLVTQLRSQDTVSIVTYAGSSGLVLAGPRATAVQPFSRPWLNCTLAGQPTAVKASNWRTPRRRNTSKRVAPIASSWRPTATSTSA